MNDMKQIDNKDILFFTCFTFLRFLEIKNSLLYDS